MEDMIMHIDDSVDFTSLELKLINKRMGDYPGKSKREVALILFCDEIVDELDDAGLLD